MRKINKTIALVLSATMVASLGTGCDKKTDKTKVETQSEQTSETVDDKEEIFRLLRERGGQPADRQAGERHAPVT